ncbi:MAG: hypothetical protein IJQ59_05725, partial [Bacteroidaceae bacterium]|nr:hypothetical protein [Bacteroidaceae bacterium]
MGVDAVTGASPQRAAGAKAKSDSTKAKSDSTKSDGPDSYRKFRVGGYGEILASFMNYGTSRFNGTTTGNTIERRNSISIPRFVIAGDYRFNKHWNLGAEIEFEAGGVGVETEMEASENGEYETEMEVGGEVALEQFHLTYTYNRAFNVRVGHMVLPVGLTNAHHEPILFFGTARPEGETTILPSTWHETGLSIFGSVGRGYSRLSYEAYVTTGLNADGFGRDHWVADGKQGLFETDNFTSPAYTARLEYEGVPGLRLGATYYFCNDVTANTDKRYKYSSVGRSSLHIVTADAQYVNKYVTARANIIWGQLQNARLISSVNLSNTSNYHHGAMHRVAKNALAYGAEVGLNLKSLIPCKRMPALYPFARYEYFNPQQQGEDGQTMD